MSKKFEVKNSKLSIQAINRFHYYQTEHIPHLFSVSEEFKGGPLCRVSKGISYFYGKNKRLGEYIFNQNTVFESIKGAYLSKKGENDQIMKINPNLYSRKNLQGVSVWGNQFLSELLQIVIFNDSSEKKPRKFDHKTITIHLVHHTNQDKLNDSSLSWLNFVQEITITETEISHTMIGTIRGEKKFLSWGCRVAQFQQFLNSYCLIDTLEGYLLQMGTALKPQIQHFSDPAYSQQQNIIKSIPLKFLSVFHQLKKEFEKTCIKDICRFMIAKEFKIQESRKAIAEYLDWKNKIEAKYKWEDFADIHSRGIFTVLGEDHMGRPVILNRSNKLNIYQVDLEKYSDYFVYFLEIYVPSLMRGHVYQMMVIGDAGDNKSQNYKLSLTKRNLTDGLKYCAERQHRLIAVNADSIAVYVYKLIRPMIPKRSQDKIIAIGSDKKQILRTLSQYVEPEIIPSYLGGQNDAIF